VCLDSSPAEEHLDSIRMCTGLSMALVS
jgi:hypothetical protein